MTDQQTTPPNDENKQTSNDTWQDIGRQFQNLGESLASAFRTTWQNEDNRNRMQSMQQGLEKMVNNVGQAIKEGAESPEVQRARVEAEKAAASAKAAGEQTLQDVRPHLVSALRQVNDLVQTMIARMEQNEPRSGAEPSTPPTGDSKPDDFI